MTLPTFFSFLFLSLFFSFLFPFVVDRLGITDAILRDHLPDFENVVHERLGCYGWLLKTQRLCCFLYLLG